MNCHTISRLIPAIYGIIIIIIVTCIFTRAFTNIRLNLLNQLEQFDYLRTYVELYFIFIVNSCMFIFLSFIFLLKYNESLKYLRHIRFIFIIFQLFIYGYSLIKFLIFYEWKNVQCSTTPYELDRFDILTVIFLPLLALGGIFICLLFLHLINIEQISRPIDPEREHLINNTSRQLYTEERNSSIVNGMTVCLFFLKASH